MKVKETYKKIITGTLIFSFVFLSFGQVFASETTDAEDAAALKPTRRLTTFPN
jgi:hypothetical protein